MTMHIYDSLEGVELSPEDRDRLIVLSTGDPSRNGSDLRDGLEKLMGTTKYQRADDSRDGKQFLIREFIGKRRRRGRKALLREKPDIRRAIKEAKRKKGESLRNRQASNASPGGQLTASLQQLPRNLL